MLKKDVIKLLEAEYSLDHLFAKGRKRDMINAKTLYIRYCKDVLGLTYWQIANMFGVTHATSMNLYNKSDIYTSSDEKMQKIWQKICGNYVEKKENIVPKRLEAILSDLNELSDTELSEFTESRLKPFKTMLQTRKKNKEVSHITGAMLRRNY